MGAAYTNSFAGATPTTLYVLQDNQAAGTDLLSTLKPPNDGTLNSVATLTINVSQLSGFDITADNQAFLSWNGGNQFGTLNLTTGQAVNNGAIGGGFAGQVVGISVSAIPEPETYALLLAGYRSIGSARPPPAWACLRAEIGRGRPLSGPHPERPLSGRQLWPLMSGAALPSAVIWPSLSPMCSLEDFALSSEGAPEGEPGLAPGKVGTQVRKVVHQRALQPEQDFDHQQVAGTERTVQPLRIS